MPSPPRCRDRRGCMEPQRAAGVLTVAPGLRTAGLRMHLPLRLQLQVRWAELYARTSGLAAGAAREAGAPRPEGGARREPIQKCGGCGPRRNSQSEASVRLPPHLRGLLNPWHAGALDTLAAPDTGGSRGAGPNLQLGVPNLHLAGTLSRDRRSRCQVHLRPVGVLGA